MLDPKTRRRAYHYFLFTDMLVQTAPKLKRKSVLYKYVNHSPIGDDLACADLPDMSVNAPTAKAEAAAGAQGADKDAVKNVFEISSTVAQRKIAVAYSA